MAIRANVLDLWTPELEHVRPGSGFDRHPQTPEARAAAVTLVPYRQVKESVGKQEPYADESRVRQIEEKSIGIEMEQRRVWTPEEIEEPKAARRQHSGASQFQE